MKVVVLAGAAEIVLVLVTFLGFGGDGDVAFGFRIGDLHVIGQQILGKEPGGKHFLRICFVENTDGGPLGNHGGVFRIKLRDGQDCSLKLYHLVGADIQQGRVGAHPGRTGGGIHREDALAGVEEVCGIARDFEGGEGAVLHMPGDTEEQFPGGVVEDLDFACRGGIAGVLLAEHLDHHVVGGLIEKGDHDLLPIKEVVAVRVLLRGRFGHLPDKVPGQNIRERIAQLLQESLVYIAGLGGAHVGNGVMHAADGALAEKLRDDLLLLRRIEKELRAAETVSGIGEQIVQRHHHVGAGHIGRDVVRIGDADIGCGIGGDVRDDIVVDAPVVGIEPHVHRDIRVQGLKVRDGLLVDGRLDLVGVVFGPEGDFVLPGTVKALRNREGCSPAGAVAGAQRQHAEEHQQRQKEGRESVSPDHPLVPPLETPAMTFLRKIRNSTISGTEMTTTAAIMAGMFSRPKPFSRISWMPLETRK